MKTATFVKQIEGWKGNAALYKLSDPISLEDSEGEISHTDHIIVSSVVALFSGPETLIFPAKEDGEPISMLDLDGSYRGGLDHETALNNAGYILES